MRKMKKLLLSVAVLATFASCAKNEEFNTTSTDNVIGFKTLNDRVSRVANQNVDGSSDNYIVFAKWTEATNNIWFINKATIDTKDLPDKTYYWPTKGSLDFYAYAPSSANIQAINDQSATISYTVNTTASQDFTVAVPITGKSSGVVDLKFKHMLSKVTFDVKLDQKLADAGYIINNADLKASFTVDKNMVAVDLLTATPSISTGSTAIYAGSKTYMIAPQTVVKFPIILSSISITKDGTSVLEKATSLKTVDLLPEMLSEFEAGKAYKIMLTITGSSKDDKENPIFGAEITFTSDITANDWTTNADIDINQN